MSEPRLTARNTTMAREEARRIDVSLRAFSGSDLEQGLQALRAVESRLNDVPLMCSHLWTSTWLRVYRDQLSPTILVASCGGQAVGACLVTRGLGQKAGPVPVRTLHLGTSGEPPGHSVCVEYNGLLVDPAHRAGFVDAVQKWCTAQPGVDEMRLDGWCSREAADWNRTAPATETRLRDCPWFDLAKAKNENLEPLELLGRSTRQNLRRLLRKYGDLETTWAESLDQADDILSELISLHQARWEASGQPGAFASKRFEEFQRLLLVQGFGDGKVVLFRARHANETVGCLLLLIDRGRMLDYVSGFASFDRKPSPGLVTHYLCLAEAARRAYRAYDFLVGEKRHKDNLSTDMQQLAWMTWRRPTLRNKAIGLLRSVKGLTRSTKPHIPAGTPEAKACESQPTVREAGPLPTEVSSCPQ